jgi:N-acylethanolamine-hydrolysing acid amidase
MIFMGYNEISWITRDALIECNDWECAINKLSSSSIIAPGYLIVAGVKDYEGAVISRDRFGPAHTEMLTHDRWFVV